MRQAKRRSKPQSLYERLCWLAWRSWVLLLAPLWMLLIYYLSAMPGEESAKLSDQLLVRKLAHFTEYGILALFLLLFLAALAEHLSGMAHWRLSSEARLGPLLRLSSGAWVLAVFYATTDEWHQIFVPGRVGAVKDVLIDSAGAFCFLLLVLGLLCWEQSRRTRGGKA